MLPIRIILCPTDFSDPAAEAIEAASELADHFTAELILLHVTEELPLVAAAAPMMTPGGSGAHVGFDVTGYQELVHNEAKQKLEELSERTVPERVRVRNLVLQGKPAATIVEVAENENADLIAIATHGHTGVRRFLFGSVAEKVVRTATCPVLTVHSPAAEQA